jgi:hypothetical protein
LRDERVLALLVVAESVELFVVDVSVVDDPG